MGSCISSDPLQSVSGMETSLVEKESDKKTTDKEGKRIPSPNPWYSSASTKTPQESYKDHAKTKSTALDTFPNGRSEILKLL